jgi:SHAQKYF class myb-like DNA-binding protein
MEVFKTKRIIYFNTKYVSKMEPDNILSIPKENSMNKSINTKGNYHPNFLVHKPKRFRIEKFDCLIGGNIKSGRWTLKEHIQYLQALEKYGLNWKNISDLIPSRTPNQIRSHSQKFYKKLKECKDAELGIDFTSRHINNINDMIAHIKSANKDYNLVNVFLYLTEKCFPNRRTKKYKKKDKMAINNNINNSEDININININDSLFNNDIKENIINKETNINRQFNNTNINNVIINNILVSNINLFNSNNDLDLLNQSYPNNSKTSNYINSNISLQNNPLNNIDIFNNYFINNNSEILLDKNCEYNNSINNFEITDENKIKGI